MKILVLACTDLFEKIEQNKKGNGRMKINPLPFLFIKPAHFLIIVIIALVSFL